ncbi:MAG: uncharacterized protein A8A55_2064 [Amphiamblys sp. WSBS2006]|nr:MAG: uncharacterized protein A8A55_2064 [Amphiamblys sp. WSBS2006]
MAVKICDFGNCHEGEKEKIFFGRVTDGYYSDILSVVDLMGYFYIGDSFSDWVFSKTFSIGEMERFVDAQWSGVALDNHFKKIYKEMEGVVSKNGLDLFLKLIASRKTGAYTAAAQALKHPFFAEGYEHDLSFWKRWSLKLKQQALFS